MNPMLGIGSGLDLSTMLNSLVQVASEPKVKQLGQKEAETKEALSGLGSLKSLLSDFQSAASALSNSSVFGQRKATVTQPSGGDVLTATADSTASAGNYSLTVNQLAQGSRLATDQINTDHDAALTFSGTADGDGVKDTLKFYMQDNYTNGFSPEATDPAPFEIDLKDGMSLNDIAAAVNEHEDNFGVTASVIDGKLIYESSVTGGSNNLEVNSTREFANRNFGVGSWLTGWADAPGGYDTVGTVLQEAQSSIVDLNGLSITRDTNTLDDVVSGVTFNLTAESTDAATIAVASDTESVSNKISAFVTAYNKLREGMNELQGSYDSDTEEFTYGKLSGDPIIRNVESVLSNIITGQASGAAAGVDTLYSVGMDIQSDGTLKLDTSRMNDALANNFDDLDELFSGAGGIASMADEQIGNFLGVTGVISGKEQSYNDILKDLDSQYEEHTRYIESYQKTLIKQFTALDSTVGRLQSTMSQIGPQLAALANIQYSSGS
ncbi:flagellar filament capping protein FliD [Oceanospirillum sediminis]|uniref:Flagellar hook-associated protein 2 n=1 Tax=Oceanospirillum sediminis TaxID=2760088 RepID=A0A839IMF1_9GAMM|nr:flagellar filament capping protein FliD [Oceanospirillum sediminis]MBB1485647.1 flagellar filament capping protein FliD [Oceanospirillum sediminis]